MYYVDQPVEKQIGSFMYAVYGWMSFALALTALAAYYVARVPALHAAVFNNPALLIFLFLLLYCLI